MSMSRRQPTARCFAAAVTTLLTASLVGLSGLVLCIGSDGHRALELEHAGLACPTQGDAPGAARLAGSEPISPADCLDLPAAGSGPATPPSAEEGRVPTPALAVVFALPEAAPRSGAHRSATRVPRAGPCPLALHLASTVLLV